MTVNLGLRHQASVAMAAIDCRCFEISLWPSPHSLLQAWPWEDAVGKKHRKGNENQRDEFGSSLMESKQGRGRMGVVGTQLSDRESVYF